MQIDINTVARGQGTAATALTPEMEQLLTELKTQLGQKLEASVARVTMLTQTETQQLLEARSAEKPTAAQRTLMTVLLDPNVRLVELAIRDRSIPALTRLPLTSGAKVQVLITTRGLLILPPQANPVAGQPSAHGTPTIPDPLIAPSQMTAQRSAPSATGSHGSPAASTFHAAPTPLTGLTSSATPNPPTPTDLTAQKTLLASAVSQTLPIAQPLKALLKAMDALSQLSRAPSATNQAPTETNRASQMPASSAPLKLTEVLNQITSLGIDPTTIKPETLRRALNASGLFYEHRLLTEEIVRSGSEAPALADRDLKGLLIQLSQWTPATLPPLTANAQSKPDTLAHLVMNLAKLFGSRQESPKESTAARQLGKLVQNLAERSLAQIQLQQYRTLSTQLQDSGVPAQWHLDIPLKLPDGYGNLYMHLFEPRLSSEEKASEKQKREKKERKGRWKVFLELELDQLGTLAAEIAVQDKTVEATLWTENTNLRERANAHLTRLRSDLEEQGVVVADLRCSNNPPPEQKVRLDYALIDVKT
jgi:hypothetical protein